MKTIHIVMRRDYLKTEPIIAFDNEEDAKDFIHVLTKACDRDFDVFHAPYSDSDSIFSKSNLIYGYGRNENA